MQPAKDLVPAKGTDGGSAAGVKRDPITQQRIGLKPKHGTLDGGYWGSRSDGGGGGGGGGRKSRGYDEEAALALAIAESMKVHAPAVLANSTVRAGPGEPVSASGAPAPALLPGEAGDAAATVASASAAAVAKAEQEELDRRTALALTYDISSLADLVRDPVTGQKFGTESKHGSLDGGYWGTGIVHNRRVVPSQDPEEAEILEALSASLKERGQVMYVGLAIDAKDEAGGDSTW